MKRYILVGGVPFREYTGTTSCIGIRVVASAETKKEAKEATYKFSDECGGLLLWIDTQTGQPGEP